MKSQPKEDNNITVAHFLSILKNAAFSIFYDNHPQPVLYWVSYCLLSLLYRYSNIPESLRSPEEMK